MNKTQIRNSLLLLLTATIWGTAFVAQSTGMEYVGPFTFSCVRSIIGGLVLIPCIFLLRRWRGKDGVAGECAEFAQSPRRPFATRVEIIGGIGCGVVLFAASNLQQIGLLYTTVGKAGFITALYVVLVPILGLFLKKKVPGFIWICVALSVIGLYLLCITDGDFSLASGDLLVLLCAVLFSVHILVIDYFSPKGDGVVISCIQFLVSGVLSGIFMLFTEEPDFGNIWAAKIPILYAGVLSCGVAYTLQVVAQKDINPTLASLIMCLESVVAVLAGWVLLGQSLSIRELMGCLFMFIAIVLAQLPMPDKKRVCKRKIIREKVQHT